MDAFLKFADEYFEYLNNAMVNKVILYIYIYIYNISLYRNLKLLDVL